MSKKIRKLLLGVLSLAMLIPSFNISVKAEGETLFTMDGILEYYQTVKGKVETNEEIDTISYKWMYSDTETGTYTEIAKSDYVTDNSITIVQGANKITDNPNMSVTMLLYGLNQPYAGKWLKYVVTINGEDYESAPGKIGDSWADAGLYKAAAADETYAANSPSENLFTADGQEFILLDDTASSASRYFVLAKNQYGTLPANTGSSQQTEKWAVYLNTEFKDSKQLPESILNNINYEQYLKVAPRYYGRSNDNLWNPAVKAGIFFLGNQEYLKYHEKIAAYEWVKKMRTAKVFPDNPNLQVSDLLAMFGAGQVAMFIGEPANISGMVKQYGIKPEDIILASIPEGPKGRMAQMGGDLYMIAKNATPEQIDAALKWIDFTGYGPTLEETTIENLKENYKATINEGGVVLPRDAFYLWTNEERVQKLLDMRKEYANIPESNLETYYAFDGVTLMPEPEVGCQ